jgi:hypothetical protein
MNTSVEEKRFLRSVVELSRQITRNSINKCDFLSAAIAITHPVQQKNT